MEKSTRAERLGEEFERTKATSARYGLQEASEKRSGKLTPLRHLAARMSTHPIEKSCETSGSTSTSTRTGSCSTPSGPPSTLSARAGKSDRVKHQHRADQGRRGDEPFLATSVASNMLRMTLPPASSSSRPRKIDPEGPRLGPGKMTSPLRPSLSIAHETMMSTCAGSNSGKMWRRFPLGMRGYAAASEARRLVRRAARTRERT